MQNFVHSTLICIGLLRVIQFGLLPFCFKTVFIVDFSINLVEARGKTLDLMFKGNAVILNCKKYVDCTQLLIIVDFISWKCREPFFPSRGECHRIGFPLHSRTDRSLRRELSCSYVTLVNRPIWQWKYPLLNICTILILDVLRRLCGLVTNTVMVKIALLLNYLFTITSDIHKATKFWERMKSFFMLHLALIHLLVQLI